MKLRYKINFSLLFIYVIGVIWGIGIEKYDLSILKVILFSGLIGVLIFLLAIIITGGD